MSKKGLRHERVLDLIETSMMEGAEAGVFGKETAVAFLPVLLACDWTARASFAPRDVLARYAAPGLACLLYAVLRVVSLGGLTPGVEFMRSEVFSGDHGLAVIEHAPFGVIGVITPVTHSLPTLTGNAINMIAAGNTLVVNPHPGGKRVAM